MSKEKVVIKTQTQKTQIQETQTQKRKTNSCPKKSHKSDTNV